MRPCSPLALLGTYPCSLHSVPLTSTVRLLPTARPWPSRVRRVPPARGPKRGCTAVSLGSWEGVAVTQPGVGSLPVKPSPPILSFWPGAQTRPGPHHEREALLYGDAIYPEVLAWGHVGHDETDVGRPSCLGILGLQLTFKLLYIVLPGHGAGDPGEPKINQGPPRPACMPATAHRSLGLWQASLWHAFLQDRQHLGGQALNLPGPGLNRGVGHMSAQGGTEMSPWTQGNQRPCSLQLPSPLLSGRGHLAAPARNRGQGPGCT